MFPVEIFEEILKNCDPVDLSRWKSVCWTWNAIIPKIIVKQTNIWHKKCESDIPENMWSSMYNPQCYPPVDPMYEKCCHDITNKMQNIVFEEEQNPAIDDSNNFQEGKDSTDVWIQLWRSWIGWHKLIRMKPSVISFDAVPKYEPDDRIICVTPLDNIIAVGSCDGWVTLFNINSVDGIAKLAELDMKQSIVDVQLLKTAGSILIVTSLNNATTEVRTVPQNSRSLYYNQNHKIGWSRVNRCNGDVYTVSFDHSWFTRMNVDREGRVSEQRRYIPPKPRNNCILKNVAATGVDVDRMLLWTEGDIHYIYDIHHDKIIPRYLSVQQPKVPIRRYQIFKPFVVGCIGELGEFGFSINGNEWKVYDLFKRFCAPVTAILFHVSVLVLGLESGEIHVFAVKDVAELQNLNFDEIETMKIHLDSKAIISLNVTEHALAQYIVAATTRNVHLVKFASS